MSRSLKQTQWRPSGFLVRPKSLPPCISISPVVSAARTHHHRLTLKALPLPPSYNFLSHITKKKNPRPVFKCFHHSEATLTPLQQKILDLCFWKGPLPEGGFGLCFFWSILLSYTYSTYTIAANHIVLPVFPCPWLLSAVYLFSGFFFRTTHWLAERITGTYEPPDLDFWKSLLPVAVTHTIGLVAAMVSLSKTSVYFAEIMRCGEMVFSTLLASWFLMEGKTFPLPVYLSLLPIIGGCVLAVVTEKNFNMTGFVAATVASFAFASMNVLLARGIRKYTEKKGKGVRGPDYPAYLSLLSFLILAPFAFAMEGPRLWVEGFKNIAPRFTTSDFITILVGIGLMYDNYVEEVYQFFPRLQPFTFFTVNTLRKIIIVVSSMTFIKPVQPINALGAVIAILGTFLHSRELCRYSESKAGTSNNIGFLISSY